MVLLNNGIFEQHKQLLAESQHVVGVEAFDIIARSQCIILNDIVHSARYGVPEIANLSTFNGFRHNISTTCGVKRNFSFVFPRKGEPQRPHEMAPLPTLSPPMGSDVHLFRQDIDSYLLSVALGWWLDVGDSFAHSFTADHKIRYLLK